MNGKLRPREPHLPSLLFRVHLLISEPTLAFQLRVLWDKLLPLVEVSPCATFFSYSDSQGTGCVGWWWGGGGLGEVVEPIAIHRTPSKNELSFAAYCYDYFPGCNAHNGYRLQLLRATSTTTGFYSRK